MNIKLVAVDMDGTLLNSKKEMPEEFIPWVKSHPEIKTVIASGRQYYTLERDFLPIRDNLAFIAENGGLVFEKGEIIFKDEIDKQDVLKCLDIIDKVPYATPVICGAKSAYITKKDVDEEIYYNVEMYYERRQIVEDLRKVADNDTIVKVAIYFKKEKWNLVDPTFSDSKISVRNLQPYYPEQAGLTLPTKQKARGMQSKLYVKSTALHIQKLWDLVTI